MANIQTASGEWIALSGTSVAASGTLGVSGVLDDEKAVFVWSAAGDGTLSVLAGGYENAEAKTISVTDGSLYSITDLDGTRSRQSDGTYDIYCTNSGTLYAITSVTGLN